MTVENRSQKTLRKLKSYVDHSPHEVAGILRLSKDRQDLYVAGVYSDCANSVDIHAIQQHPRTFHTHPRNPVSKVPGGARETQVCPFYIPSQEDILFVYNQLRPDQEHWVATQAGLFCLQKFGQSKFDTNAVAQMFDVQSNHCHVTTNSKKIREWARKINQLRLVRVTFVPWPK